MSATLSTILAGAAAYLRAATSLTLPEASCTVARTGTTVACRVNQTSARAHLHGTPEYIHLREWQITAPDATDILEWDVLAVASLGEYLATGVSSRDSYSTSAVVQAIQVGTAVDAMTLREPGPLMPGAVAAFAPYLSGLSLRPIMGLVVCPVTPQAAFDAMGTQIQQPARVLAEWPAGYVGALPVQARDVLVINPTADVPTEYQIAGCRAYQDRLLEIYIDLAQELEP